jgi:beta-lactamase regulating signal transducer with metallopeptidase domain
MFEVTVEITRTLLQIWILVALGETLTSITVAQARRVAPTLDSSQSLEEEEAPATKAAQGMERTHAVSRVIRVTEATV